jgi:hypothetical protein
MLLKLALVGLVKCFEIVDLPQVFTIMQYLFQRFERVEKAIRAGVAIIPAPVTANL